MTTPNIPAHRSRRLRLGAAGAAVGLVATLLGGAAHADTPAAAPPESQPSDHADYTIRELGPAIFTTNVRTGEFGVDGEGNEVVYALSNGEPATFSMVDPHTGEQLFAQTLDRYELGGFLTQADDGQVIFTARTGSYAGLFRFDPAAEEITELDVDLQGQRVLYKGPIDDDGVIWFGTYPGARVMAYDTNVGELLDYGSVTDDAAYVFSVGVVGDEIWAGTGPVPHLFRMDPETGETTEMFPPDHVMANTSWFIGLEQRGDYVFVRLSPRGSYDMAVYNLAEDRWLDDVIEGTFDTPVTDVIDNKVYFLVDDVLTGFDMETETTFSTGFEDTWLWEEMSEAVGTYALTAVDGEDGPVVTGINTDGQVWHYNVATQEGELVHADVLGSPAGAHAMGVGPDGSTYMSAYLSSGAMSRIAPGGTEVEHIRGPKQGSAIIAHEDLLVVSTYPGAGVHVGEAMDEWRWSETEQILDLRRGEPHFQDRIMALASMEDRIAAGSVPDYGQVGGALTFVDPETGDFDFHRNVVEGQSIVTLDYHEGIVYGGTSIHGGIDSTPVGTAGEFFLWDVEAGERISSEVVDENAAVINEVTVGPEGTVWGLTSTGVVFTADPATGQIQDRIETGLATSNNWGRTTSLYHHDGYVYGNAGNSMFRVDPESHEVDVIVDGGVRGSVVDGSGQIYFAGDINVYALDPVAPQCDRTITGVHNGPLTISGESVCITDATLRGPLTVDDGASVIMTDSTKRGPVNISGAADVVLQDSSFNGPVNINNTTGSVTLEGNTISGPLSCSGNAEQPQGGENTVRGPANGQCADLVK